MKCNNCNTEVANGAKFCHNCGQKLNEQNFCNECGAKLTSNANFCPNCGTPRGSTSIAVNDNNVRKDIFTISPQDFDQNALGNGFTLLSFDEVAAENDRVAHIQIDNNHNVVIMGIGEGRTQIAIGFTYRDNNASTILKACWIGVFEVARDYEISFLSGSFVDAYNDTNNNNIDTSSGNTLLDFAAAFLGGFIGGALNQDNYNNPYNNPYNNYDYYDNDEYY